MSYLIDTNILLRSVQTTHPMHQSAVAALARLTAQGETLFVLPQNVREFWNVATRPAEKNGLGFSVTQAEAEVQRIEAALPVLEDNQAVYRQWRHLVLQHQVFGVQVHDAAIAAAMLVHAIPHLLTFNTADFIRYSRHGITAISPSSLTDKSAASAV